MWTPPINESAEPTQWALSLIPYHALQMHCTENLKQIFPRGLVPNFYIHVSVSNLFILTIGPQTQYSK
jgi:hypothetical protein